MTWEWAYEVGSFLGKNREKRKNRSFFYVKTTRTNISLHTEVHRSDFTEKIARFGHFMKQKDQISLNMANLKVKDLNFKPVPSLPHCMAYGLQWSSAVLIIKTIFTNFFRPKIGKWKNWNSKFWPFFFNHCVIGRLKSGAGGSALYFTVESWDFEHLYFM